MNILQIGANRGSDDLTHIIYDNKDKLGKVVLVEPLSILHSQLQKCYENISIIIEPVAISAHPTQEKISFFYAKSNAPNYEVASLSKEHVLFHGFPENDIVEEAVVCYTVNELLNKHNLWKLDLLFIDAEGYDDKIIRSINFNKFSISEIIYENIHIKDKQMLSLFLRTKNYKIFENWGLNGWSNRAVKQPSSLPFIFKKLILEIIILRINVCRKFPVVMRRMLKKAGIFEYAKCIKRYLTRS